MSRVATLYLFLSIHIYSMFVKNSIGFHVQQKPNITDFICIGQCFSRPSTSHLNIYPAKLIYLNFYPLELVSRYRDQ